MSKELTICLDEEKFYFPGDAIKGHIKLDLKRSADIQFITLNFKGTVEGHGEKVVLIDQIEILASPANGQKYTVFNTGKIYKFEFEFKIPKNKSLPSFAKVPKIANISYFLTATPKKPSFNFSHTLPTIVKEVKILDLINVDLPDYCRDVNMNSDLGFTNGSKPSQWNLSSKFAFIRGDNIELECNINNFPPMKKSKAIKVSLIRHVYKSSSAKIIEKKVLSFKTIDLHTTDISSTQSISIKLHIPSDTPPSVFPDTGRILSISYILQAELNMKGVKAAIKLKDTYAQETTIVIGTFPKAEFSIDECASIIERKETITRNNNIRAMSTSNLSIASNNNFRNTSAISLPVQRRPPPQKNFHGALTDSEEVEPLARLDECSETNYSTYRRSYLSRNNLPSTSYFDRTMPRTPTPMQIRRSYFSPPQTPIDRSLTPLPSVNSRTSYNTISYINRSRSPMVLKPSSSNKDNIIILSPHEIGPDDIINRGTDIQENNSRMGRTYYSDNEKVISDMNYDGEKEEDGTQSPQVPSLIRHDTVSTASSNGLIEDQYHYATVSPTIINKYQS